MTAYLQAVGTPGGALAVLKDGQLVYTQAYGLADRDRRLPVRPGSLFRIASLSKPITAVAVFKLVEEGKLDPEARAFDLVRVAPLVEPGKTVDPRLMRITVRQLLQHTGGWDRERSFEPAARHPLMARALGVPSPVPPEGMIRYMLGQPLDFEPGTRSAYSNFGYVVLGRVIERAAGMPYERYVREKILGPLGITRMRIGASLQAAPDEVRYCYTDPPEYVPSVFSRFPGRVEPQYGGFCLESMDAHGGWIASVEDLARIVAALDRPGTPPLLKPETMRRMLAPPEPPVARGADGVLAPRYYACGWAVTHAGSADRRNFWHTGNLEGNFAIMVRRWDGWSWIALFNRWARDGKPYHEIDGALHRAANAAGG